MQISGCGIISDSQTFYKTFWEQNFISNNQITYYFRLGRTLNWIDEKKVPDVSTDPGLLWSACWNLIVKVNISVS